VYAHLIPEPSSGLASGEHTILGDDMAVEHTGLCSEDKLGAVVRPADVVQARRPGQSYLPRTHIHPGNVVAVAQQQADAMPLPAVDVEGRAGRGCWQQRADIAP
jgi:hypothetical protein